MCQDKRRKICLDYAVKVAKMHYSKYTKDSVFLVSLLNEADENPKTVLQVVAKHISCPKKRQHELDTYRLLCEKLDWKKGDFPHIVNILTNVQGLLETTANNTYPVVLMQQGLPLTDLLHKNTFCTADILNV